MENEAVKRIWLIQENKWELSVQELRWNTKQEKKKTPENEELKIDLFCYF